MNKKDNACDCSFKKVCDDMIKTIDRLIEEKYNLHIQNRRLKMKNKDLEYELELYKSKRPI